MNGTILPLTFEIRTGQETNQNSPLHLFSICHIGRTVTVAIKVKLDSVMLCAASSLLQTRFDISINHALKGQGWGVEWKEPTLT